MKIYLFKKDIKNKPKKKDNKPWLVEVLQWSGNENAVDPYYWQQVKFLKGRIKRSKNPQARDSVKNGGDDNE